MCLKRFLNSFHDFGGEHNNEYINIKYFTYFYVDFCSITRHFFYVKLAITTNEQSELQQINYSFNRSGIADKYSVKTFLCISR